MQTFLQYFPPVDFAIAYGSAVVPQQGYSERDKPLIDFIFAVENARIWHEENLKLNSNHYSFIRLFGPSLISNIQENYGGAIYYNTNVLVGNQLIKYGVITSKDLIEDLKTWKTLYVSGRMQKPVEILKNTEAHQSAQLLNLQYAITTSLLLLPSSFSEEELFKTITAISYTGDPRMGVAENPNKVNNIVSKNLQRFSKLYRNLYPSFEDVLTFDPISTSFKQEVNNKSRISLFQKLPSTLQQMIHSTMKVEDSSKENSIQLYERIVSEGSTKRVISSSIASIVKKSSLSQTMKGIVTSGIGSSISYASKKVLKAIRR